MALPFGADDLNKLKGFIDFVTQNPTILNMPQLDFVKKFVEKFGGKVPSGEFKMPAGGKCPFGGDDGAADGVKSEPTPADPESDPEVVEMESDPESEVELDMEVTLHDYDESQTASNAIYLQETPCKKAKKNTEKLLKAEIMLSDDEEEFNMDDYSSSDSDYEAPEDPINTTEIEINIKTEHCDKNLEYKANDFNDSDDFSDDKVKKEKHSGTRHNRHTRANDLRNKSKKRRIKKPKTACLETCKQKCRQKIDKEQRRILCAEYWSLNFVERKNYLLACVETKHKKKIRARRRSDRPTSGFTNHYLLKGRGEDEHVRVCLTFFLSTLAISSYVLKNALKNSDGKGRYIGQDNRGGNQSKKAAPLSFEQTLEQTLESVEDDQNAPATETFGTETVEVTIELDPQNNFVNDSVIELRTEVLPSKAVVGKLKPPKPPKLVEQEWIKYKKIKKDHTVRPVNCEEVCQFKCTRHFNEEQRSQICKTFWSMDYKRRKDFVLSRVESRDVDCITTEAYRLSKRAVRSFSNKYYLRGPRGDNIRVCANFFMATLCIGRGVVYSALRNADSQTGSFAGEDMRGKHTPANKIPDEMKDMIKSHIESYPTWMPHKNYKTRFLHSSLNIRRMFNEYKQICLEKQLKPTSCHYFSDVFHKQYRLEFLKPVSKKLSAAMKKSNPNISEFTGEETGGFWSNSDETPVPSTTSKGEKKLEVKRTNCTQRRDLDTDPNQIHIQENRQLHAPPPHSSDLQMIPFFMPPSSVPQQRDTLNAMSNFVFDQQSSTFRIL